jgi:hypothetical protein
MSAPLKALCFLFFTCAFENKQVSRTLTCHSAAAEEEPYSTGIVEVASVCKHPRYPNVYADIPAS